MQTLEKQLKSLFYETFTQEVEALLWQTAVTFFLESNTSAEVTKCEMCLFQLHPEKQNDVKRKNRKHNNDTLSDTNGQSSDSVGG